MLKKFWHPNLMKKKKHNEKLLSDGVNRDSVGNS